MNQLQCWNKKYVPNNCHILLSHHKTLTVNRTETKSPQFTFCHHWIMSSGTVCTGNPLALSSNCHSRCWGELEGTGKCRVGLGGMFDRGREVGPCWGEDYSCRGSGRRRHWGWGLGSEPGSGPPQRASQGGPSTASGLRDSCCCCGWGWKPSPAASGGGFEGLGASPGPWVCLGSWGRFGGAAHSRGTGGWLGCSRHGSPSCYFWPLWNTPWGGTSCSAAWWQRRLLKPKNKQRFRNNSRRFESSM